MSKQYPAALHPTSEDIKMMLACQVHQGTRNLDPEMERYVWKRRADGFHIFNLQKTWEKLMLAARIIVAVENPEDVCVISARPWGQRAALKYSLHTGAKAITGRFTPGTFTNQIQAKYQEPRVLILTDPRTDHQAINESSYVNLNTIAFCHSDSPTRHIDCVIPANNRGKQSVGLLYWLLTREVLRLRRTISRTVPWDVMVDLFFYRDPEEIEKEEAEQAAQAVIVAPQVIPGKAAAPLDWSEETDAAAAPAGDWPASGAEWTEGAAATAGFDASVMAAANSWSRQ
mmetsp:Transcript_16054/g.48234  ORF Transcript_16054/g.48234 Transcript_16054/m.48234 type:complete len:286 (-) Transcript_16054:125-982(-)|eukprot:CAMPEP_0174233894 /NCGR_PEP_ID=MMETSP0417-20130205/3805_1 /TAXON_ID=242541 /ORGANISM="Mayorella sp, Strain BSH-02190019" /LENGTH=285 /DNA_ID=CAMNT_0015312185 /DNA_START=111 /DNA_END=968 /DNA_ORIENTATION=+